MEKVAYNNVAIDTVITQKDIDEDITGTIDILNKWRYKNYLKYGESKPIMVLLNTSGGGSRASYWAMYILQQVRQRAQWKIDGSYRKYFWCFRWYVRNGLL